MRAKKIAAVILGIVLILATVAILVSLKSVSSQRVILYLKRTYPRYSFSLQKKMKSPIGNSWSASEKETGTVFRIMEVEDGGFTDDLYGSALQRAYTEYQKDMVDILCWDLMIIEDQKTGKTAELRTNVSEESAEDTFIELNSLLHYMTSHKYPITFNVTIKADGKPDKVMTFIDVMTDEKMSALIEEYGGEDGEVTVQ